MHKRGRDLVSFFGLPKARKVGADKDQDTAKQQDSGKQEIKKVRIIPPPPPPSACNVQFNLFLMCAHYEAVVVVSYRADRMVVPTSILLQTTLWGQKASEHKTEHKSSVHGSHPVGTRSSVSF